MAIQGTIVDLGDGKFGFESKSPDYGKPQIIRHVWELSGFKMKSSSWCEPVQAIGRAASITDGVISCYLGNGNYFYGFMAQGGSTPAIITDTTPVPRPRVKATTELRWRDGAWQKLTRKGWIGT